jgi:hypothetical protein
VTLDCRFLPALTARSGREPILSGSGQVLGSHRPGETAGLTDRAALTAYRGPSTITGGTVVIDSRRIGSRLRVEGGNVTIRNSAFAFEDWYHLWVEGGTVLVEHSEFDGLHTTTNTDDAGVAGVGVTVRWSPPPRHIRAGGSSPTWSTG